MNEKNCAVVCILNQKGGVGKTTLTTNLGFELTRRGSNVLLVDADPQGSLRDWNDASNGVLLPVVGLDRETLASDIRGVKEGYDIILVDGAPQSGGLAVAAIKAANIVLIPVTPSPYDIWACADLVDSIKARQSLLNGSPSAYFVISRARKNTVLSDEVETALIDYQIPVLCHRNCHREVYAQTASDGLTVHSANNRAAIKEIEQITTELLSKIEVFKNVV